MHKQELPALFAYLQRSGIATPFSAGVSPDPQDPEHYTINISQSGLGLPDRDYYLKDDDVKLKEVRSKYQKHIEDCPVDGGEDAAAPQAAEVLDIEMSLAAAQWTRVEMRDPVSRTTASPSTSSARWRQPSTGRPILPLLAWRRNRPPWCASPAF